MMPLDSALGTGSLLQRIARLFALSTLLAAGAATIASPQETVEALVSGAEAPPGVVFEIVSADEAALVERLPLVTQHASRLRARFPTLDIAVVTHGAEQFSLLTARRDEFPELHALVETFQSSRDIPVHVCATHASWRDKTPEEFPDYVDVATSAAAQLNDYRALGFVIIQLF